MVKIPSLGVIWGFLVVRGWSVGGEIKFNLDVVFLKTLAA